MATVVEVPITDLLEAMEHAAQDVHTLLLGVQPLGEAEADSQEDVDGKKPRLAMLDLLRVQEVLQKPMELLFLMLLVLLMMPMVPHLLGNTELLGTADLAQEKVQALKNMELLLMRAMVLLQGNMVLLLMKNMELLVGTLDLDLGT